MAKTYVIDTNVLIQAPYALFCFEENQVVLPLAVLEELDGLKKAEGERGANAREAIRHLEKLRLKGNLPVSYTHLDVYKRQHPNSFLCWNIGNSNRKIRFPLFSVSISSSSWSVDRKSVV